MKYYVIWSDIDGVSLEITTQNPGFDSEADCFVEEFESFLEAKNCALEKCIYIRDMAASQVRFFRSLRKRDID